MKDSDTQLSEQEINEIIEDFYGERLEKPKSPFRIRTGNLKGIKKWYYNFKEGIKRNIESIKDHTKYRPVSVVHISKNNQIYLVGGVCDNYSLIYRADRPYYKQFIPQHSQQIFYFDGSYETGYLCSEDSPTNIIFNGNEKIDEKLQLQKDQIELSQKRLIVDHVSKGVLQLSKEQAGIMKIISIIVFCGGVGIGIFLSWIFLLI